MPRTIIVSRLSRKDPYHRIVHAHLVQKMKHPEKGSIFERKSKYIRWLPAWAIRMLLREAKYDGQLRLEGNHVINHIFFQRHGSALHVFAVETTPEKRGRGIAQDELAQFINFAIQQPGITRVRLGTEKNERMRKLVERFREKYEKGLGIKVHPDGWVDLYPKQYRQSHLATSLLVFSLLLRGKCWVDSAVVAPSKTRILFLKFGRRPL